jgi:hypothetical protein
LYWDNDGTAKPTEPTKVNCWDAHFQHLYLYVGIMMVHNLQHQKKQTVGILLLSTILLVLGIMMEPHNLQHQKKTNCWDTFTFNNSTCTWDNDGTAKPTRPTKVNCWDTLLSTILLVRGIMMNR